MHHRHRRRWHSNDLAHGLPHGGVVHVSHDVEIGPAQGPRPHRGFGRHDRLRHTTRDFSFANRVAVGFVKLRFGFERDGPTDRWAPKGRRPRSAVVRRGRCSFAVPPRPPRHHRTTSSGSDAPCSAAIATVSGRAARYAARPTCRWTQYWSRPNHRSRCPGACARHRQVEGLRSNRRQRVERRTHR